MTKRVLTAALVVGCALVMTAGFPLTLGAQTPRVQWTRQYGGEAVDQGTSVGYGEFGVYVAGQTVGEFPGQTSAGGKDAFISLHDESGKLKWIRQFGTPAEDVATGVAGDGSGAYVVGYTRGSFGSQIGEADAFIRKYGPDGNVLWTRQFGSTVDDYASAVTTHTSGVYVVGHVDCCGGVLTGQPGPTASADAFVRKYGGDGQEIWTRVISTINSERATGVAVDDSGVYVAGTTNGDLVVPVGSTDGYLRKYSHDGALLWSKQFATTKSNGDAVTDDVFAVAAGPSGVYVAGATAGGTVPGAFFVGGLWDAFVIKYDPNGNAQWFRQIGTDGDDYAYGIAVGSGYVLVTGGTSAALVDWRLRRRRGRVSPPV